MSKKYLILIIILALIVAGIYYFVNTYLEPKTTCEDMRNKIENCWVEGQSVEEGKIITCETIKAKNNCEKKNLTNLISDDSKFDIDHYRKCKNLGIFYSKSINAKSYNKVFTDCPIHLSQ